MFKIEKNWPRRVRTLYAHLRTGHAKELRFYRYLIEKEDNKKCDCGFKEESIKHVLCDCKLLKEARRIHLGMPVKMTHMATHPEECRKFLAEKFDGLRLPDELNA